MFVFNLFSYLNMDSWIFYTLGFNPIPVYFVAQIFQIWLLGLFSVVSCVPLMNPYYCMFAFLALPSLLSGITGCSRLIMDVFPPLVIELDISPKSPGSFHWRRVLETKIWMLGCLLLLVVLILGPL